LGKREKRHEKMRILLLDWRRKGELRPIIRDKDGKLSEKEGLNLKGKNGGMGGT